uniref:Cytochrome b6-f complex subunit n=1 Tax=Riquetophycus sp. TaxID=1897556 RepID=A0A1C9C7Y0_9FLOR|nr:cytochrome b6-f complex subunit [Riquetophycus sp.]
MFQMTQQNINVKKIYKTSKITIIQYLKQNGIIVGQKKIDDDYNSLIIEFKDHTRLCILPQELQII